MHFIYIVLICIFKLVLKTWLRSNMSEKRFALLNNIHRHRHIQTDETINKYAGRKKININFV